MNDEQKDICSNAEQNTNLNVDVSCISKAAVFYDALCKSRGENKPLSAYFDAEKVCCLYFYGTEDFVLKVRQFVEENK